MMNRIRDQKRGARTFKNKFGKKGKRLTCFQFESNENLVPSNKCKPRTVLAHDRQKRFSGVPAIHSLKSFISGMVYKATGNNDFSHNSDLPEMDSFSLQIIRQRKTFYNDVEDDEEFDEVMFTNLLSAKFRSSSVPSKHESPEYFRQVLCRR